MKGKNTLNKTEKLKSRKLIEQVFAEGAAITVHPLRLVYVTGNDAAVPVQVGVTVSSRNFKKATHRNRVKRILREAYRFNKHHLQAHASGTGQHIAAFIIYTDKSLPALSVVNSKMQVILNKLIRATSEEIPENT